VVQDLGRPGYASIGIAANGASDQGAARTANVLVGNADGAPVVETSGADLELVTGADLLLAVTGAADHVLVDGHPRPGWETLVVTAGSRVVVSAGRTGLRSYLAVNGELEAERLLGSVSPDPLLGPVRRLEAGDRLVVQTRFGSFTGFSTGAWEPPIFRLGARRQLPSSTVSVDVTPGPDLSRMAAGAACLEATSEILPQSDHVGLRLSGSALEQTSSAEILSRGVPVGAVEVPPTGGIIILLRGRLVTAGYPVIAVVTTPSLDRLGQARPGDSVRFTWCDVSTSRARLRAADDEHRRLATRVRAALVARGLQDVLDPRHGHPRKDGP
jgi:5-oxoprolinase (ATP-hydrolysing) subunit C